MPRRFWWGLARAQYPAPTTTTGGGCAACDRCGRAPACCSFRGNAPLSHPHPKSCFVARIGEDAAGEDGEEKPKEKPNFETSGLLAKETNMFNGVEVIYSEPQEARKSKIRWRLYPFKGEVALDPMYIHRQSAYLIGKEKKVSRSQSKTRCACPRVRGRRASMPSRSLGDGSVVRACRRRKPKLLWLVLRTMYCPRFATCTWRIPPSQSNMPVSALRNMPDRVRASFRLQLNARRRRLCLQSPPIPPNKTHTHTHTPSLPSDPTPPSELLPLSLVNYVLPSGNRTAQPCSTV